MSQFNQQFITLIIDRYGLELDDERQGDIVATWIGQYDRALIVKAIVESLHRGRYKIKSVDSILSGWQRTGKLSYNFTPEFEREILQDLPTISELAEAQPPPQPGPPRGRRTRRTVPEPSTAPRPSASPAPAQPRPRPHARD